ncbi:MAG TPA: hypothetical protein DEA43_00275 [Candidatus Moranbacteria bacterium]|nr:hypothetical protein [Candidatus Moranbacteria bacterium]HBT45307.1 hypothetical protein [Candidatus Moranbacteria bacterium]
MNNKKYDSDYFKKNSQSDDRLALYFFSDILKKYFKSGKILEYGCGTGFFIKKFTAKKYEKSAFDISEYAMNQTRENNSDVLILKDPWKQTLDNSLDCIASLHVLEHISNPSETLSNFNTKLKSGGILFFIVPNTSSMGRKLKRKIWFGYRDETHISLLNPTEWRRKTTEANFEIIKIGTDGLWDIPYFKTIPIFIQKLIFYPTAAIQIWTKSIFLPLFLGENLIIIAKKL